MTNVFKEMLEKGSIVAKSLPMTARGSLKPVENQDQLIFKNEINDNYDTFDGRRPTRNHESKG